MKEVWGRLGDVYWRGWRVDVGNGKAVEKGWEDLQAGSRVSISILRYTGFSRPTLSFIFLIIPSIPIVSISLASTISKPQ